MRQKLPVSAIGKTDYIAEGHKLPSYEIDTAKCIKCGVCLENCKRAKAISKRLRKEGQHSMEMVNIKDKQYASERTQRHIHT